MRAVRAALEIVPAVGSLGRELALAAAPAAAGAHRRAYRAGRRRRDRCRQPAQRALGGGQGAQRRRPPAGPGGARLDRRQRRDASPAARLFATTSLGRHELAGIGETIEVFRIESEQPVAAMPDVDAGPWPGRWSTARVELAFLERPLGRVRHGEGQAVLLSGEPGIGKSRLVRALVSGLQATGHQILLLQCSPYFADSPLHPVIEHLERAAAIDRRGRRDDQRLERLERLVGSLREQAARSGRGAGRPAGDRADPLLRPRDAGAGRERRPRTLDILATTTSLSMAAGAAGGHDLRGPALGRSDDPRVAGPLLARLDEAPLLALIAVRSDAGLTWARHGHRPPAAPRAARAARTAPRSSTSSPRAAARRPTAREDPGRHRRRPPVRRGADQGAARSTGRVAFALADRQAAPGVVIPATIQDSLTARLDRLGEAKQVAQVAATIGREFSRDLLAAVARSARAGAHGRPGAPGQSSGLVLPLDASGEQLAFKHALVRDAAYDGLLRSHPPHACTPGSSRRWRLPSPPDRRQPGARGTALHRGRGPRQGGPLLDAGRPPGGRALGPCRGGEPPRARAAAACAACPRKRRRTAGGWSIW